MTEALFAALEGLGPVAALRSSRWAYAAVSGAHVLGIALLVGAILPFDLKLLGLWPRVARRDLARVLLPVAACGLGLAIAAGFLLFSVRATDYADLVVFQVKIALILSGLAGALAAHLAHGPLLDGMGRGRAALHGALSMACWLGALACGRAIAFVMG